ncbi:hypothetical protein SDC9_201959 [bioreactor metagenome]|uniref:Uncharacterized protein n=1 Tax=bioreactor metagenome TaxID=1076179 RepID=A0A645IV44_9ZZZZ
MEFHVGIFGGSSRKVLRRHQVYIGQYFLVFGRYRDQQVRRQILFVRIVCLECYLGVVGREIDDLPGIVW